MDNQGFWNERYRRQPWIGSGPGSRGIAQHYKAELVRMALSKNDIRSVLDVGCGDMCWLRTERLSVEDLSGVQFVGLDISDVVVANNRRAFPRFGFKTLDLTRDSLPQGADLVLCFDVLIHQTFREQFDECLRHLLQGIGRHGLVSYKNPERPVVPIVPELDGFDSEVEARFRRSLAAFQQKETYPKGETAYFGGLPNLVAELSQDHGVRRIGDYNFQSVYDVGLGSRLVL